MWAFEIGEKLRNDGHVQAAEYAFDLAAQDGHADACFALGCLSETHGTAAAAARWFLEAGCCEDHFLASYRLGRLYQKIPHDDDGVTDAQYADHAANGSVVAAFVLGMRDAERGVPMPPDAVPEWEEERQLRERRANARFDDF